MSMGRKTTYERWIHAQGVPVYEGFGVENVRQLSLGAWPRSGGKGAFIQLRGMEGFTGMYVGEISPGDSLQPEKHLYEELIYILEGQGATEVWWENEPARKVSFEWAEGALFAIPLNSSHRLLNGSDRPARFLAVTSAPLAMDLFHDPEFILGCDRIFAQRFDGSKDYFVPTNRRGEAIRGHWVWESNFIADLREAALDSAERKGAGVRITALEMSDSTLVGHIAEWPVGRYHKAHHHHGGAILLILRSQGYTLMWPQEMGERPYQADRADQVVRVDWREGSVLSPPTGWFHQHFNTGKVPARQMAFRYSGNSGRYPLGIAKAFNAEGVRQSTRNGGTLIEYEDEDPRILRDYVAALAAEKVRCDMPPIQYRQG